LGVALGSEIRGTLEALVFNCLQATMAEEGDAEYTDEKMQQDIEALYKMGQGKFGTDEKGLFKIMCTAPPTYLKKLNMAYAEKHGLTLEHSLTSELKGISKDAAQFLFGMKINPYETIAKLFDEACKGAGTDETLMASILIRYQTVMKEVMLKHVELFGKTMADRVRAENRGVDEALFLELLAVAEA
jgi:Annexin